MNKVATATQREQFVSRATSVGNLSYVGLIVLSGLTGLFLFFQNPSISLLTTHANDVEWYAVLSDELFRPNTSYIAESILLPLLAKLVGANVSSQGYRLLCVFITLLILPILTIVVAHVSRSLIKTFFFLLLFSISFRYLWAFQLGFPDPLTILLITIAAVSNHPRVIFVALFLAALSHFSMTLLACITLIIVHCVRTDDSAEQAGQVEAIKSIVWALIIGRCTLSIWYFLFEYKLVGRVSVAYLEGLGVFASRYKGDVLKFWFTPGIAFLLLYCTMLVCFICGKRYKLLVGAALALSLAYAALFFTTDGLRVFAVVISGFYARMLMLSIDAAYPCCHAFYCRWQQTFQRLLFKLKIEPRFALIGLVVAIAWFIVLLRAKGNGLLLNSPDLMKTIVLEIRYFDLLLAIASIFVYFGIGLTTWRENKKICYLVKIIFILPLVFMVVQYLRQIFAPDQSLPIVVLVLSMLVVVVGSTSLAKIDFTALYKTMHSKCTVSRW
jgi:hypothetical protein